MIEILQPGILASIQDGGRFGYRKIGVTPCGAMDSTAFQVANILVGNVRNEAAIEVTLGGIQVRFHRDTVFALTGANIQATLDGVPLPPWWVQHAQAGQILKSATSASGMYAYLAIAGGLGIKSVLGSASTDAKGGFGGQALRAGNKFTPQADAASIGIRRGFCLNAEKCGLLNDDDNRIRMMPAAEWHDYTPDMQARFLDAQWRVQPDSNRIGYRLAGPVIEAIKPRELLSHGILPGVIQLPPSGQPVVQMNDANTCGGYPKLGVVIAADLHKLAQTRLGAHVRFELVDRETAIAASKKNEARLQQLEAQAALARQLANGKAA